MGVPASKRKVIEALLVKYKGTGLIKTVEAEKYGPEIARIARDCGGVATPAAIVEEARAESSPLHEWVYRLSDAEAVHQHRLDQATYLVRHVVEIVVDVASGEEIQVRPFIHFDEENDGVDDGYYDRRNVSAEKQYEVRLEQALGELRSFVRRFADLAETAAVTREIREVLAHQENA